MPDFITSMLADFTLIGDAAIAFFIAVTVASFFSKNTRKFRDRLFSRLSKHATAFAFAVALASTLFSIYYSEIAHYEPCRLCWYQRIMMFPQAILLGIALFRKDKGIFSYIVPMSVIGAAIAAYHYLIQVTDLSVACSATSVSCSSSPFFAYGFITIPFMALTGFLLITTAGLINLIERVKTK